MEQVVLRLENTKVVWDMSGAPRHHLQEVDAHSFCGRFQFGCGPHGMALAQCGRLPVANAQLDVSTFGFISWRLSSALTSRATAGSGTSFVSPCSRFPFHQCVDRQPASCVSTHYTDRHDAGA